MREKLRSALAVQLEATHGPDLIRARVVSFAPKILIEVEYRFGGVARSGSYVLLDLASCPLQASFVRHEGLSPDRRFAEQKVAGPKLLAFRRSAGVSWAEVSLVFRLFGDPDRSQDLFVLPELLPQVIPGDDESERPQPMIAVSTSEGEAGLIGGILRTRAARADDGYTALQYIMAMRPPSMLAQQDVHTQHTTMVHVISDGGNSRLLETAAGLVLQQIVEMLGLDPSASVVWTDRSRVRIASAVPYGALITDPLPSLATMSAERMRLFSKNPSTEANLHAQLAIQLARVWWIGGCRLTGPRRWEWANALATATGLYLAFPSRTPSVERVIRKWQSVSLADRLRDSVARLRDSAAPVAGGRLALQLYEGLLDQPEALQVLRECIHDYWGLHVPPSKIVEPLSACGVQLDL